MPRPARAIRSRRVDVYLPEDIYLRVQTLLWSELENRVPHGGWSSYFTELARESLTRLAANQKEPANGTQS